MTISEALDRLRKLVGTGPSVKVEFGRWDYGTTGICRPYRGDGKWYTWDEKTHYEGNTLLAAVEAMEHHYACRMEIIDPESHELSFAGEKDSEAEKRPPAGTEGPSSDDIAGMDLPLSVGGGDKPPF